jgi:hypothetical protein
MPSAKEAGAAAVPGAVADAQAWAPRRRNVDQEPGRTRFDRQLRGFVHASLLQRVANEHQQPFQLTSPTDVAPERGPTRGRTTASDMAARGLGGGFQPWE